jgi:hypothetical protein
MPNNIPTWDRIHNMGNPTKSVEVNNFIKLVEKLEVRKKGSASQTKRPLQKNEFQIAIYLFERKTIFFQKIQIPTRMKLQYHLIRRSDDICKLDTDAFYGHPDQRFARLALSVKVSWSKAVIDERRCPDQILLGSMDPDFFYKYGNLCRV